ncbi:MAG TPA: type I-B CRISPR-associated endonuclease Cas1 [Sulfurihydrogenibium sp.]|uniref:type I-B CRISPR-associated endonuclease Cas1b n=1 Tax=Sulfurihydrogenibium sp. (strain YO3AOP1) TaxID=436114 RepID=UPI0001723AC9|nr:type I-B CRISPR-associated endonuclease Cas1b [Sulfurihydrogenibium sp. YO3AOP1]ACD66309.1 CRISPR-associated protein Cas1 [Sulfurihydrogenibium sp. YO3AOP1]HBT98492.1 type I-B CRISPR-associated endonuclease Cas1 [Sulfurihydrogenibium sp.]
MSRRYYINNSGRLKRKENTIFFEISEKERKIIPINDIDSIYIFGEVDLNTKVLNYLAQNDIPVHIFNYYGYYSGSFLPKKKNVSGILLVSQVSHYTDYSKRLYLAKSFIEGGVYHILRNLKTNQAEEEVEKINEFLKQLPDANTIEEVMAVEGNIRNIYYQAFNKIIKNQDFKIDKREYNPPTNPINALISFGNSVLYSVILSEIYKTHLEPTISYLHEPSERRFSLSLDISEIFKPLIVDTVIFNLLNYETINLSHFNQDLNFSYLNDEGRKIFLKYLEDKLETTIKHKTLQRNVSYRTLIRLECYKLIKHLLDEEDYKPLKAWW